MSTYNWGEYTKDAGGNSIYDVRLDRTRQIGFASYALYKRVIEYSEELFTSEVNKPVKEAANEVASLMRLLIIGNTNASVKKFKTALTNFFEVLPDSVPNDYLRLVDLCSEIIKCIEDGIDYTDILINGVRIAGIYNIESSSEPQTEIERES